MDLIKTHYQNLQVTENASLEVIKAAYRSLAQKWHPDKNGDRQDEAHRNSQIINAAYAALSDPNLRLDYDKRLAARRASEANAGESADTVAHRNAEAAAEREAKAAAQRNAEAATIREAAARSNAEAASQREAAARKSAEADARIGARADAQQGYTSETGAQPSPSPASVIKHTSLAWNEIWIWIAAIVGIRYWGYSIADNNTTSPLLSALLSTPIFIGVIWCVAAIITGLFLQRLPRAAGVLTTMTIIALLISVSTRTIADTLRSPELATAVSATSPTSASTVAQVPANSIALVQVSPGTMPVDDLQKGFQAIRRKDYASALDLLKPLAEKGNAVAQYNVGAMYDYGGMGVTQNYAEAIMWYGMAADQGEADARYNLGMLYFLGKGVQKNLIASYALVKLSNSLNNSQADTAAVSDKLLTTMSPQQIAAGTEVARQMQQIGVLKALAAQTNGSKEIQPLVERARPLPGQRLVSDSERDKCNSAYQDEMNSVDDGISLGEYAEIKSRADKQLMACLYRR